MNTRLILTSLASIAVVANPLAASAGTASAKPAHHAMKHKAAKKVSTTTTTTTTATKPASK